MTNLLKDLPKLQIISKVYRNLPESAGIYIFFKNGIPIYIGKAINIKKRVSSYFDLDLQGKTAKMVSEATEISFIQVVSELEALLLEAKVIREYMPKYNIISKDDKHPLYIQITKEKYPRILAVRKLIANDYSLSSHVKLRLLASYGPFPSSKNVRSVLRMIRRIFPYSDHKVGKHPCLYSHIGLCNPCPNEIEHVAISKKRLVLTKKYLKNIRNIKAILNGHIDKVVKDLGKEMKVASDNQNYEEAAKIRGKIERLEYITRPQIPTDFYILNPNLYEDQRKLEIESLRKLIVNCPRSDAVYLKIENLHRIECYDVAHLSGTNATASMVTFIDGKADKTLYRHFKIQQIKGNSDIDSMKEIITRRIKHLIDWDRPDLIIVDGGTAQVKAFTSVLYSGKVNIPVVGVAKNPDRLIVGDQKIKSQVYDPVGSQTRRGALNLVQRIRDEAHRFARVYHHKLVSKSMLN